MFSQQLRVRRLLLTLSKVLKLNLFRIVFTCLVYVIIFCGIAFSQSVSSFKKWEEDRWNNFKKEYPDVAIKSIKNSFPSSSALLNYYFKKYTSNDRKLLRMAAEELFPHYTSSEIADVVHECLAYRHLVYSETRWHKLEKNLETARHYENLIQKYSDIYGLPWQIPLAVISWENSGSHDAESYAACGGLGQMSWGAVERSHSYAMEISRQKKAQAQISSPEAATVLYSEAEFYNLDAKHKLMTKKAGLKDERMVPECNIEDSVIYLKILLDYFDGRSDLAISAYHNGVANNDDLVRAYTGAQRYDGLLEQIRKNDVKYIDLWQHPKVKNMMNGWFTMDGVLVNPLNAANALGDESDIYPWKIVSSFAAYNESEESVLEKIDQARVPLAEFECRDLELYDTIAKLQRGKNEGKLFKVSLNSGRNTAYMTPELYGFIKKLAKDISALHPNKAFEIPFKDFLSSEYVAGGAGKRTHLQGVAITIDAKHMKFEKDLRNRLWYYYLHDRLYYKRNGHFYDICLNPRYGLEFLGYVK